MAISQKVLVRWRMSENNKAAYITTSIVKTVPKAVLWPASQTALYAKQSPIRLSPRKMSAIGQ